MFTSTNAALGADRDTAARLSLRRYAIATVALGVFGAIYEHFSFGVFSPFMAFAFVVPLVLGVVPAFALMRAGAAAPQAQVRSLYAAGVAMLAVGCALRGVLDIYGTTNAKLVVYPVVGVALLCAACVRAARSGVRQA